MHMIFQRYSFLTLLICRNLSRHLTVCFDLISSRSESIWVGSHTRVCMLSTSFGVSPDKFAIFFRNLLLKVSSILTVIGCPLLWYLNEWNPSGVKSISWQQHMFILFAWYLYIHGDCQAWTDSNDHRSRGLDYLYTIIKNATDELKLVLLEQYCSFAMMTLYLRTVSVRGLFISLSDSSVPYSHHPGSGIFKLCLKFILLPFS